jgi:hypothetical protein
MKSTQLACYALLASAFILGGLLLTNVKGALLAEQARAHMVINRQNFTVMTTLTRANEEAVFVLNNMTNRLLIYTLNVARNELVLVGNEDMARQFSFPAAGARPAGARTPR